MTDRERAIVMAYTGVVMLAGDKISVFYDYVSEKLGRPVYTHEFLTMAYEIKKLSRTDFLDLCAGYPTQKPEIGHDGLAGMKSESSCCDEMEELSKPCAEQIV